MSESAAQLLVLNSIKKVLTSEIDGARERAAAELNPGDRRHILIDGVDYGYVLQQKSSRSAQVEDEAQFLAYAACEGQVHLGWRLMPGKRVEDLLTEVAGLLPGLAGEFGEQAPVVSDSYRRSVLVKAEAGETIPGVTVAVKQGSTSATPNGLALEAARSLVRSSALPAIGGAE